MALSVGESEKSSANSWIYVLTYGELHIYPRTETCAPLLPASVKALAMIWMFCSLLVVHLVCKIANLNFFIQDTILMIGLSIGSYNEEKKLNPQK